MAKISRVPVENQITTLSVVKIAIKFSPCTPSPDWFRISIILLQSYLYICSHSVTRCSIAFSLFPHHLHLLSLSLVITNGSFLLISTYKSFYDFLSLSFYASLQVFVSLLFPCICCYIFHSGFYPIMKNVVTFNYRWRNVKYPRKSCGLEFIPNRSHLFRNLYPCQSELIRVNPKKVFILAWCKWVKNLSDLIRDFESEWIQTNFLTRMNMRSELFGLRIQFKLFWLRIHSD